MLEVVEEQEDETVEEFTKRVQTTMATTMGLVPTDFTSADKVDYAKKKFIISPSAGNNFCPISRIHMIICVK